MGSAALAEILHLTSPADIVLRRYFRQHAQLGRRDRGFIAETIFATLRRLRHFTHVTGSSDPQRLFITAAQTLPASEQRDLLSPPGADEHAQLVQLRTGGDEHLPIGVRAELPDWAIALLRTVCSEEDVVTIGRAMQTGAPLDLRVNTLRITREDALDALNRSGMEAYPTPYSPLGIRLRSKPALEQHALFLEGKVEVQDEGSQLLGILLAPRRRELVIDFCAGAGGKTLLLGGLMRSEGRLYAFDVSEQRLRRLRTRLARAGLSNVHPELIAHERDARLKRLSEKADRVLVDAPCTGFGTLRRNPDLKWRQTEEGLAALRHKQANILDAAARLLKPGGRLVYATCSIFPQENDDIVEGFLDRHAEFKELDCAAILAQQGITVACGKRLRLLPHLHGTDGFFAVTMERSNLGTPSPNEC